MATAPTILPFYRAWGRRPARQRAGNCAPRGLPGVVLERLENFLFPSGLNYCDALSHPSHPRFSRGLGLIWVKNKYRTTSNCVALDADRWFGIKITTIYFSCFAQRSIQHPRFAKDVRCRMSASLPPRKWIASSHAAFISHINFPPCNLSCSARHVCPDLRYARAIAKPCTWFVQTPRLNCPLDAGLPQKWRINVGDLRPRSDFQEACAF
jgi:hypothetical protein